MKNNNKFLSPIVCAFLLSSSVVCSADECKEIHGKIITNTISTTQQFGVISIHRNGKRRAEICGILGTTTGFDAVSGVPTELEHLISCKRNSTITTVDDVEVTSIVPCSEEGVILEVVEETTVTGGTGRYAGAYGEFTTTGDVNLCTGINRFTYEGELCIPED